MKNKETSNIKIQKAYSSLILMMSGIFRRDGLLKTDKGIVCLHPSKGTHWVCYINDKFFHCYGCSSPEKLSKPNIKRKGYCLSSDYQIKKTIVFVRVIVWKYFI